MSWGRIKSTGGCWDEMDRMYWGGLGMDSGMEGKGVE